MSEQLGRVAYEAHGGGEPWHKLRPHTKRSWMKAARDVLAAARGGAQPVELNPAQVAAVFERAFPERMPWMCQSADRRERYSKFAQAVREVLIERGNLAESTPMRCGLGSHFDDHRGKRCTRRQGHTGMHRHGDYRWSRGVALCNVGLRDRPGVRCDWPRGHEGDHRSEAADETWTDAWAIHDPQRPSTARQAREPELTPVARVGFEAFSGEFGHVGRPIPDATCGNRLPGDSSGACTREQGHEGRCSCGSHTWQPPQPRHHGGGPPPAHSPRARPKHPGPPPVRAVKMSYVAMYRPATTALPVQHRVHDARGLTLTFERYPGRSSSNGGQ